MPTINDYYAQQRATTGGDDVQVVPRFERGRVRGIVDRSKPTVRQMREHNVSIFAQAVQLRGNKLAGAITGLMPGMSGFDVLRRQMAGNEPVEDGHPWRQLIHRPNPSWSAFRFWRWMSKVRDLQGHADAVVERDGAGVPTALWPVYSDWGRVTKELDGKGEVEMYHFRWQQSAEPITIEPENLIRLEHPDPVQAGGTASLVERGVYELTSEVESKRYEKGFLEDGRPPNVYVKLDSGGSLQTSTPEQREEASERMQQGHMGKRANKLPVLEGGEFKSVGIKPDDLQMLESREMRKDDIFTITGIPPAMMGKDPTNANVEGAERIFSVHTLQPMAVEAASTITQQFERAFRAEEGRLKVQASNVVPQDEEEQEAVNAKRINRGVPPAQIMEEQGEEIPEGQKEELSRSYVPKNLVPAAQKGMGSPTSEAPGPPPDEERSAYDFL